MNFECINPLTGAVASTSTAMQVNDMATIVEKAQNGFSVWSTSGPNARRAILNTCSKIRSFDKKRFI